MEDKTVEVVEVQKERQVDDAVHTEVRDPYGFIYITTNLINGMRYLGQKSFRDNWKTYLGSGVEFKKALKAYGKENFKRNIILVCYSEEELNQAEYDLSLFFDVVESPYWYNLVLGGGTSRGWHPTEETKRKIGQAAKERLSDPANHPRYGKPGLKGEQNAQFGISPKERMSEDTYNLWYEKHKKYWANPPTKGKHIWEDKPHPNLGKAMPKEQKEKIGASRVAKHIGSKPIFSPELNQIFWGAKEATEKLNIPGSNITVCCKNKMSYAGRHPITKEPLHWVYVYDQKEKDGAIINGAITLGYITEDRANNYLEELRQKGNDT